MTIWPPDLSKATGPRYQAIADAIAAATMQGALQPGDRLPPQRELAYQLGVTVGTVSRGYTLAEQRGVVHGEVGRGTFVNGKNGNLSHSMLAPDMRSEINLSMNMPLAPANGSALAETLLGIANSAGAQNLLRYMPTAGHADHRTAVAQWISQTGFDASPANIILTEGAQQGLAASFDVLAPRGETVLVENYTYSGLIENARLKGTKLRGVALDSEGMRPDALDKCAVETGAKVVIVVPTIQNPTAAVMSETRRLEIAAVATERDLVIVEDDVYGYLPENRPPPIAALLPDRTVHVSGASKCLAPGLRVGWLVAPDKLLAQFTDVIYAQSVAQPALTHEIIRRWIEDGTAARLVSDLRKETAARQALAAEVLTDYRVHSHPASFHLLLELPKHWQRDEFMAAALEREIRVASLTSFAVDPARAVDAVRLSLVAVENRATLRQALVVLRNLLEAGPEARRAVV